MAAFVSLSEYANACFYIRVLSCSDQVITLLTVDPPISVRIVSITTDYGLLRTLPQDSYRLSDDAYIDLQPDGNSFDMMAGLIRAKS